MHTTAAPARCAERRGFTLLEVLVVVMILAIMASLAVPRLSGTARRTFDLTVDQVADLLIMFAQRDTLGQKPVGLVYDPARQELALVVLGEGDSGVSEWLPDRFVAPVKFPDVVDAERIVIVADGEWVDISDWPLSHTPGEARPSIEISLQSRDDQFSATLTLSPHAVSPRRSDGGDRLASRRPMDLDSAGRSREEW